MPFSDMAPMTAANHQQGGRNHDDDDAQDRDVGIF